ncbi:MAG: glycosyltransferase [Actinomycetota bacterium]|nr:glycosyltransferase [Actinomycetota bacterium]
MPRFSVVIAAYNAQATIESAVRSALSQTLRDLEVIVVDDGSTDGTVGVVTEIDDPRLRLVQRPNGGPSAARNSGALAAKGELVAFLDGDDLWLPSYAERACAAMDANPDANLVYTDGYVFESGSGRVLLRTAMGLMHPPDPTPADRDNFLTELLKRNFVYNSVTVRASVLAEVGGYDETLSEGEDYELWLRMVLRGYVPVWMGGVYGLYRWHAGQAVRNRMKTSRWEVTVFRRLASQTLPRPEHSELVRARLARAERVLEMPMGRRRVRYLLRRARRFPTWLARRSGPEQLWRDEPPPDVRAVFPDLAAV